MTSNLKWTRAEERAIVRGNQSIAKYGIPPNVDYGLFENGVPLGNFKTADEAMKAADARRKAA